MGHDFLNGGEGVGRYFHQIVATAHAGILSGGDQSEHKDCDVITQYDVTGIQNHINTASQLFISVSRLKLVSKHLINH